MPCGPPQRALERIGLQEDAALGRRGADGDRRVDRLPVGADDHVVALEELQALGVGGRHLHVQIGVQEMQRGRDAHLGGVPDRAEGAQAQAPVGALRLRRRGTGLVAVSVELGGGKAAAASRPGQRTPRPPISSSVRPS